MTITSIKDRRSEKGFTLVELAIVLIIVGLLITGVLKGQELIANAEVASTASAIRSIDAAAVTFRDSYNGFPGDMTAAIANARLPGCNAACGGAAGATAGNGRLELAPGAALNAAESQSFWEHLHAANLITNDNPAGPAAGLPSSDMDGFYGAAWHPGGALAVGAGIIGQGHYILIGNAAANTGVIRITQAARLDRKTDDGVGNTGTTQANAAGVGGACHVAGLYQEAADNATCLIAVGMSN